MYVTELMKQLENVKTKEDLLAIIEIFTKQVLIYNHASDLKTFYIAFGNKTATFLQNSQAISLP